MYGVAISDKEIWDIPYCSMREERFICVEIFLVKFILFEYYFFLFLFSRVHCDFGVNWYKAGRM